MGMLLLHPEIELMSILRLSQVPRHGYHFVLLLHAMIKNLFSLFLFFILSLPCYASNIQMHITGLTSTAINTGATTYFYWDSSGGASTTENLRRITVGSGGTIIRMKVYLTVAPDNGAEIQSVAITTFVQGIAT